MAVSRKVTVGTDRHTPIRSRISPVMAWTGSSAWRHAIAWIAPFMPPWRMRSSTARGIADQVVFCSARCAATCRTVQPSHSDGWRHSFSDRSSSRSTRARR
jgi:hypothetical protein